ncbi:hypothetical protein QLL95_gp0702 [Cotonvirus japonicus]|uniref:Uncharacterized protein n=1 Tax=Cotonvirus japonicus TaxID=2811091 RepID=A0ABM7NTJ8_9VIRU|nr:hypothetical protein QLL95_gp0702 [Cotonvirus japonicus]BCS83421.1 hypothetical protein [Cotonvirus japonicus]
MSVDSEILLYTLASNFHSSLGIELCKDTEDFLKKTIKKYNKLTTNDKIYYTNYSLKIIGSITKYLNTEKNITLFELNTDNEHEIYHDFRIAYKKDLIHFSLNHKSININNIIPEKLMKICGYKKNTNICKEYSNSYDKLNKKIYNKINDHDKYSEIKEKTKNSAIIDPINSLLMETIAKKRKCAKFLYDYIFNTSDRIVLKLYKNRFTVYDFRKELDEVTSFSMKLNENDVITTKFNNGAKFSWVLKTNASDIKEHISLKYHINFDNLDELFAVDSSSV